jgi:hypothetical protein
MDDEIIPDLNRKRPTRREWVTRFLQHGPWCHYCKIRLTLDTAVKEHLTPLCRGGADSIENLVPSCEPCNTMKAFRTEAEFLRDRPMLMRRRTASRAIASLETPRLSMEEINEPGLLKKMVSERENQSGWWKSA